jgi:outer membrane protein OmpA-like peptidoglycan-associated protein
MGFSSRSRMVVLALGLATMGASLGCNRERREAGQLLTNAVKSYAQLQPQVERLRARLSSLRHGMDDLADAVPGGADLRARYFTTEEVLGVLDAKVKWLSGELERARREPKKDEVIGLQDVIAGTFGEIGQVSNVLVELTHEESRLQRVAALLRAPYEHKLSTGYVVKAASEGVESRLIGLIEDKQAKLDKATWLDFDRLVFLGDGADLDILASRSQLDNVAKILEAHPGAKLKIGGYWDGKAGADASKKLSAQRAQAVRTALIQFGVNPRRLEAEGYGAARPVCPEDDSDDCKARNRRVAVLVTAR